MSLLRLVVEQQDSCEAERTTVSLEWIDVARVQRLFKQFVWQRHSWQARQMSATRNQQTCHEKIMPNNPQVNVQALRLARSELQCYNGMLLIPLCVVGRDRQFAKRDGRKLRCLVEWNY
eukprot:5721206-Amphidinium_carterae.1